MRFLIAILSLVSIPGFSWAVPIADYPAQQITDHTYVIHGPLEYPNEKNGGFMNNPGFVITSNGVVVIDPGSSVYTGQMVLRQIRKVTNKPVTHILNTHVHGDHWLGNQAFADVFPKAVIMAHPKMITQAKNGEDKQWLTMMERLTRGATKGTRAIIPNMAVDDAYQFKAGGITFKIYAPGKAHSGTDIMIHVVEESVVFGGDNILNGRIARMDDATFRGNINACDVAMKIKAKHYVPGHGLTGDSKMVGRFKKYLVTLYIEVGKLYEQGMSDFEMKPKVVASLNDFHDWNGFNVEVGRHINLAMLEVEAAMFE
ncbi:MAG: MBL fold metallo-hydrolase [Gammaproteobacteria bacterium]|jgi:glyoxylase-like metal-dependent hydrolase (beta-lactamase superfamily II)